MVNEFQNHKIQFNEESAEQFWTDLWEAFCRLRFYEVMMQQEDSAKRKVENQIDFAYNKMYAAVGIKQSDPDQDDYRRAYINAHAIIESIV